tara:strand:+ start:1972 stop:2559 length:588 start_codon:yes stop_codon:yes gene_type:complete
MENHEKADRFNTWDHVRKIRDDTKNQELPLLDDLDEMWSDIARNHADLIARIDDERTASTPLSAFLGYIDQGFCPPHDIILAVSDCFQHYFKKGGEVELEDVFFNSRRRGVGNHAAVDSSGSLYKHLWFLEQCEHLPSRTGPDHVVKSISSLADEMFHQFQLDRIDIDNFLRSYRRWKRRHGMTIDSDKAVKPDT